MDHWTPMCECEVSTPRKQEERDGFLRPTLICRGCVTPYVHFICLWPIVLIRISQVAILIAVHPECPWFEFSEHRSSFQLGSCRTV